MTRTMLILMTLLLLAISQAAWATAPSDPNTWATATVDTPALGDPAGSYTSTWSVVPASAWPDGWLLIGVEFQPSGGSGPSGLASLTQPAGWNSTLYNPSDGWLAWYANGTGQQSTMTDANGLASGAAGSGSWIGSYTTTGDINSLNYHLVFVNSAAGPNDQGKWEIVQSSLTATGSQVPEPGTLILLGTGLAGLGAVARRRKRAA